MILSMNLKSQMKNTISLDIQEIRSEMAVIQKDKQLIM